MPSLTQSILSDAETTLLIGAPSNFAGPIAEHFAIEHLAAGGSVLRLVDRESEIIPAKAHLATIAKQRNISHDKIDVQTFPSKLLSASPDTLIFYNAADDTAAMHPNDARLQVINILVDGSRCQALVAANYGPGPAPILRHYIADRVWKVSADGLTVKLSLAKPALDQTIEFKGRDAIARIEWKAKLDA